MNSRHFIFPSLDNCHKRLSRWLDVFIEDDYDFQYKKNSDKAKYFLSRVLYGKVRDGTIDEGDLVCDVKGEVVSAPCMRYLEPALQGVASLFRFTFLWHYSFKKRRLYSSTVHQEHVVEESSMQKIIERTADCSTAIQTRFCVAVTPW